MYVLNAAEKISTPEDFAVKTQTTEKIVVGWNKVPDAIEYTISWGTDPVDRTDWESIDIVNGDTVEAEISTFGGNPLDLAVTYYFTITATDGVNTSAEAGPIEGQINALPDPTNFGVDSKTNTTITVSTRPRNTRSGSRRLTATANRNPVRSK